MFELWLRAELIANADQCSINTLVLGCVYLLKNSVVVVQTSKRVTTDLVLKSSRDYKLCTVWFQGCKVYVKVFLHHYFSNFLLGNMI